MTKIALNIHLFRPEIKTFSAALGDEWQAHSDGIVIMEPRSSLDLPFECRFMLKRPVGRTVKWADFVQSVFDVAPDQLVGQSVSAALLLIVDDRMFGISFGYGYNAIRRDFLEPDFGLRVALNSLSPEQIRSVSTRTPQKKSLQQLRHISVASPLNDFQVDLEGEWVRDIAGNVTVAELGSQIKGGESVHIDWDGAVAELPKLCRSLFDLFERTDYQTTFPGVDQLRPVAPGSAEASILNQKLYDLIDQRDQERLALAHPRIPSDSCSGIRITGERRSLDFEDVHLYNLYSYLDTHRVDPRVVRISQINSESEATFSAALMDWLSAQIEHDGETYTLAEGRWFRLSSDYIQRIQAEVESLPDVTADLDLPVWRSGLSEGEYNKIFEDKDKWGWGCVDKQCWYMGHQQVEPCDLFIPPERLHLVPGLKHCGAVLAMVKKMEGSTTLSHLFAQGSVSADMLRLVPDFREYVSKLHEDVFGNALDDNHAVFVFAIGTEKEGMLAESLYLFSKINLVRHTKAIRRNGYQVALCRIEREVSAKATKPSRRRNKA